MTSLDELQAQVASAYDRLHLPGWADPHPGGAEALTEEYSRVTDPDRYRIVHARGRAWATVLERSLGARVEVLDASPAGGADSRGWDRGLRLEATTPGSLALLVLEQDVPTRPGHPELAVLTIAVERPELVVERQPDCGCDACDTGSVDLLGTVDAAFRAVVGGPFVVLRGEGWHAQWSPGSGSMGSDGDTPDFRTVMDWCRRLAEGAPAELPERTEALVGRAWT